MDALQPDKSFDRQITTAPDETTIVTAGILLQPPRASPILRSAAQTGIPEQFVVVHC
jgi:hypothetical protein